MTVARHAARHPVIPASTATAPGRLRSGDVRRDAPPAQDGTPSVHDRALVAVARLVAPGRGALERVARLTPYATQIIADDARAAGAGARLEVTLRGTVPAGTVARVHALFAGLAARGVEVRVAADPPPRSARRRPA